MSSPSRLSKTRFCQGLQCPKLLWWRVHEPDAPELEAGPELQAVFDRGHLVGEAARERFPGGVLVDAKPWEVREKVEQTRRALADGAEVIYEASFLEDDVFVAVDVLERRKRGFRLIEVKSTTKVKPEAHLPDVAIQLQTLRRAGLDVRRAEVMHLDPACRFPDLSNLFARADVTKEVEEILPAIPRQVRALKRMLAGPMPEVEVGPHCEDPYPCPFAGRCHPPLPRNHVTNLYRLHSSKLAALLETGVELMDELPDGFELSGPARRQAEALRRKRLVVEDGLEEALAAIEAPAAFLDFETVNPAIPVWRGCGPYQPVPVQMSCHRVDARGRVSHQAFLAEGPGDPRRAVAEAVVEACEGAATVVAYNAGFERGCLERLAAAVPSLRRPLRSVARRLVDLLPIVRDHVYHPKFEGGFGLKAVLPALVPGLGYDDLAVAGGDVASSALEDLLLHGDELPRAEVRTLRSQLLAYCERDTLAMVKLVERLRELAAG
jgi:hypothetical protein